MQGKLLLSQFFRLKPPGPEAIQVMRLLSLPWPILLYWHHPSNSITLRIISTVTHQDEQARTLVSSMRKSQCQRLYPLCHRCFHKNWTLSFQREVSASFCYSHLIVHNVSSHTQPSLTDPGSPPLLRCSSVMMTGQSGADLRFNQMQGKLLLSQF